METNTRETIIGGDRDDTSQATGQMMDVSQTLQGADTLNVDSLKLKEKTRIAYTDPRQYQTTSCKEEQEQNQSHSKSDKRDGNGLVMCCLCHQQHYHKLPSDGHLMAIGRKADRKKHGGGQWTKR